MPPTALRSIHAALVLMLVLSGLDQTILSTALPAITASLDGRSLAPWVFSAYLMASTAVIPLYGKLADRLGVRPLLLVATGFFALGSLACAGSTTMAQLVAARALQGLGGGGLMTLTLLAVAALVPPAERPRRMGQLGAAYGVSTLVGPLVGGLLLESVSWHWAFLINVPGAACALWVLWRARFGAARPTTQPFDAPGAALLAGGLMALLLATRAGIEGGSAAELPAGFAALAVAVLLGAWVVVERRAADPIVPLGLFRRPAIAGVALLSALSGVALFAAVVFVPIVLQQGLGLGALASSLHTMPLMLGIVAGSQLAGRALRAGQAARRLATVSSASLVAGYVVLAMLLHRSPLADLALSAALLPVGLGLGLLFPLVTAVAQRSVPPEQLGVATAVPVMLRALGGALGVSALGAQLHAAMDTRIAALVAAGTASPATATQALAAGVGDLCLWAAGAGLLVAVVARTLPGPRPVAPALATTVSG